MSTVATDADAFRPAADAVLKVAELAAAHGREDLAQRLQIAVARVTRPATIICVVGEFKQGKSSLLNAMLGEAICPVDDDLATSALTMIRYGPEWRVEVRRRVGNEVVTELASVETLSEWVSEAGNPKNHKGVERVDVLVPNPGLAAGMTFVDTPGMGSLGAGHAAATLSFLPFADALIFVSDASSELAAPEVEFLKRARELCPNVLFALTKTDLYAEWRRIADLDTAHLVRAHSPLQPLPLSSALRGAARERCDASMNVRSGFPALFDALREQVVDPAKALAADRAIAESNAAAEALTATLQAELEVLTDADRSPETAARAEAAVARLEHLRGPGARWSVVVNDRVADLSNNVNFGFRGAMRQCSRDLETQIEEMKSPKEWDALARDLQTQVAEAVTAAFVAIESGAQLLREEVVDVLALEAADLPPVGARGVPIDVRGLWLGKDLDPQSSRGRKVMGNTLTGIRGAQSGIMMFGMMARFLPAGIGALMLTNPVTIGLGAAFGGLQLLDAHKRRIAQRRQAARAGVRQFTDDVQFEIGNAINEAIRVVQREIRDEFTARTTELQRTYADSARAATEAAKRGAADAQQRATEVMVALRSVAAARAALVAATTVGDAP